MRAPDDEALDAALFRDALGRITDTLTDTVDKFFDDEQARGTLNPQELTHAVSVAAGLMLAELVLSRYEGSPAGSRAAIRYLAQTTAREGAAMVADHFANPEPSLSKH